MENGMFHQDRFLFLSLLLCDKTTSWYAIYNDLQSSHNTLELYKCCWGVSQWFTAICHILKVFQNRLMTYTKELSMKSEMVHLLCQLEGIKWYLKIILRFIEVI